MTNKALDIVFTSILTRIENGEIKTTNQLRLVLEDLGETYDLKPLQLIVTLREWMQTQGIDLSTDHGVVTIEKIKG